MSDGGLVLPERDLLNRDLVVAELAVIRCRLRSEDPEPAQRHWHALRERFGGRSTLDEVVEGFGLTDFERSVLLLAAGPDLASAVLDELAPHTGLGRPTFGVALATQPEAHWSALAPVGPLRWWELIRLADPTAVTASPLLVDERILHHIAGVGHVDVGLATVSRVVDPPRWMPPTLARLADDLAAGWRSGGAAVVHGPQPGNVRAVVAGAATSVGLVLREVALADLPRAPEDRARMLRLMERETVLAGCAWAVGIADASVDERDSLVRQLALVEAPVALMAPTHDGVPSPDATHIAVPRLAVSERREAYASALRRHHAEARIGDVDAAAGLFDLPLEALELVARDVGEGRSLWQACRSRQHPALGGLASIVTPRASWGDLVLPATQLDQLRGLVAAVRHRWQVLDDWGFARRRSRGLGTAALFAGPSGTGKTMSAEVIAHDLDLALVQVDLSQVVSKYIGETEKQLRRLFDAAEDGGVVLLFDEADTLFGKRSEVRDSHDRYANLEVGYLLQRLESFDGLAILTTNARSALDQAFTRRLSTIVSFPYPDPAAREALWRRAFPVEAPLEGVDAALLSKADLSGGDIAAAALQASYLAAAEGGPIQPRHVDTAIRWELGKAGRSATPTAPTRR